MSHNVPSCLDQLYGHTQATYEHKTKITNANLILCWNETLVCCTMNTDDI